MILFYLKLFTLLFPEKLHVPSATSCVGECREATALNRSSNGSFTPLLVFPGQTK